MERETYRRIERFMLECMQDSAHDKEHVYRVLYNAMTIAREETVADMDVLIAACLLHDVARAEQMADPSVCHAQRGSEMAYAFLTGLGWTEERAAHVRDCVRCHRFRKGEKPERIEARILYDADKLDVTGAIGLARTLAYNGAAGEPIYSTAPDGTVLDGSGEEQDSFCREYRFKLEKVYDRFLTRVGARLAGERRKAAQDFYRCLMDEVSGTRQSGRELLDMVIQP